MLGMSAINILEQESIMRAAWILILTSLLLATASGRATHAQGSGAAAPRIDWEVKNRFRLFRSAADFERQIAAYRNDGVFGAEERLAHDSDGRGWARDTVERLCVDRAGKLMETCDREGARESYLTPRDHPIGVALVGLVPQNVSCAWSFEDGQGEPRRVDVACNEEVRLRVAYGRPTLASVDIVLADGTAQRVVTEIAVRDVLIAGMGDSIAAGDGNPDRPVRLSDEGFCFRRFLGGGPSEYYRPGRDGFTGNRSCSVETGEDASAADWARQSARWESGPCHRSLYSYQMRTALALAIENPRLAVTFLPLACTGATIATGFLGSQGARECASPGTSGSCQSSVRAQIAELTDLIATARRQRADRNLDLVLLTIGANDIQFSGLVADVIIQATTERLLFGRSGHIASVADSQKVLDGRLPADFARLRAALKPLVGGNLARVVFVSYGNPALAAPDTPCPGGRDGFDVHPAFGADGGRMREVANFVSRQFLPKIKALALCEGGGVCRDPRSDRMTFADAHQAGFASHGVCVRADTDPAFDRDCFSPEGKSFDTNLATAARDPLACSRPAAQYRPYAARARWIRTANDSYFTAMSYPQGVSALQPVNIHDASWGVLSAVYGGAIHPTAQGHAAMADAALPAVRAVLGLANVEPVARGEPPRATNDNAPPAQPNTR
jgi:hypothetical protein